MSNPSQPPRFQFSLRWIFVIITVVAIFLGVAALVSSSLAGLIASFIVAVLLPAPLAITALFDRGRRQAFAIGALTAWFGWLLSGYGRSFYLSGFTVGNSLLLLFVWIVAGGLAVAQRHWIERLAGR